MTALLFLAAGFVIAIVGGGMLAVGLYATYVARERRKLWLTNRRGFRYELAFASVLTVVGAGLTCLGLWISRMGG